MQIHRLPMTDLARQLRQRLEAKGSAELLVTGYSMVPTLRNGKDSVTLVPAEKPFKAGDVIFYQREDGQLVLHRIIRVKDQNLVCSGDHQHEGELVRTHQVLAVVSGFNRGGKHYSVNAFFYRFYSCLITLTFPVRRPCLAVRKAFGNLKRALRRK